MTTSPLSLWLFYSDVCTFLASKGNHITCVAGPGDDYWNLLPKSISATVEMPFVRPPRLFADFWCLLRLWWFFLWNRFDVVHCSTPKAMVLGSLAAFLSGQWNIVLTVHGRVYENATGLRRRLLERIDRFTFSLARCVIPVCRELGEAIVSSGCPASKIRFIGPSCNGVDTTRFSVSPTAVDAGMKIRRKLGIPNAAIVILYVGRIHPEKGINELTQALLMLRTPVHTSIHLVLLGFLETADNPLTEDTEKAIRETKTIHLVSHVSDTVPWYAMADIVAFPSYREGFGNVSIEAAAMERPVVGTDIMGIREGIIDGTTGILVQPRMTKPLAGALQYLVDSPGTRIRMGRAARKMVELEFQPARIWHGILDVYEQLERRRGAYK